MRKTFPPMRHGIREPHDFDSALPIENPQSLKMMDIVEAIVDAAEDSKLCSGFYEYAKTFIDELCSRQNLTRDEGVILSILISGIVQGGLDYRDVGNFLDLSNMKMLNLLPVFESLSNKRLIEVSRKLGKDVDYAPVPGLVKAYRENKAYIPPSLAADSDEGLLSIIFDTMFSYWQNNLACEDFESRVSLIINENNKLPLMRKINEYGIEEYDLKAIIMHMCSLLHFDNTRDVDLRRIAFIEEEGIDRNHFIHDMQKGEGTLFESGIIEHVVNPDGLVDNTEFRLTDKAVRNLLPDYKSNMEPSHLFSNVVVPDKIAAKDLFFDNEVRNQIDRLCNLLESKHFLQIQHRLVERHLRKGFCCLFYGAPGTGKTATAMELARQTGRKIVTVDLSTVRNMYVGKSERNVQGIFDSYKEMLRCSTDAPILLLNEADGLLTKRNTRRNDGVDKMENTMQNILLQNMEDFEGIMIATTNLAVNLDAAFERRFLYKVEFHKPDFSTRAAIWRSLMPTLDKATIERLAKQYEFSGGQIENIARKSVVDSILYGDDVVREGNVIEEYCRHERISSSVEKHKMGFC